MLEDNLMTVEQVIEAMGISRAGFYNKLRAGLIPRPIELGPHRKVWDRFVIEKFIIDDRRKKSNKVVKDFLDKVNNKTGDL